MDTKPKTIPFDSQPIQPKTLSFDQTQATLATVSSASQDNFGMRILKGAGGVLNAIEQPFMSLAATPTQALAKAMGRPDPFAQGAPGLGSTIPVSKLGVEEKTGDLLKAGSEFAGIAVAPETLLGSTATFGAIGAAQAGGQAMSTGKDVGEVAKKAFIGGLVGAATGAVGYGVQKGVDTAITKGPIALYNNAIKVTKKIRMAGDSPSEFLADEGVWGSLGSMSKTVQEGINTENAKINQAAVNATGGITYDEVKSKAVDFLSKGKLGDLYSNEELQTFVDAVPVARMRDAKDVVPWTDANGVRSSLGSLIGDNKWLQTNPSEVTQAHEAVYGALSNAIKKATGTANNFAREANWIRANKAITGAIDAADAKWEWGLRDSISAGVGATIGAFTGQPWLGATIGIGAERAAKSPAVRTGLGQLLSRVPLVGGALGRAAATLTAGRQIGK